jgi:O-antigen/teichoic acid export membrane protein
MLREYGHETTAILDQIIVSLSTFLTAVFLARFCSKAEYSLYYLAITQLPVWDNIRLGLVGAPFTVYFPRKPDADRPAYVGTSFLIVTAMVGAGALLVTAGAWTMETILSEQGLFVTLLGSTALVAGFIFRGFFRSVFYVREDNVHALWMDAVIAVFQLGGIFVLYCGKGLSAFTAVLVIGAAQAVSVPYGLAILGRSKCISFQGIDIHRALGENWIMGRWLIAKSAVFAASVDIFPWFLKFFRNDAPAIAALAVSLTAVNLTNPFWIGYTNNLSAQMANVCAREGPAGLRRLIRRSQIVLLTGMGTMTALLCLFAKPILRLLYGVKYQEYGYVVVVLAVVMLISVGTVSYELALITMEQSRRVFFIYVKILILCLIPSALLIYHFGLQGTLMSYVLSGIMIGAFRIQAQVRGMHHE